MRSVTDASARGRQEGHGEVLVASRIGAFAKRVNAAGRAELVADCVPIERIAGEFRRTAQS
jgi:hypothetical protein